MRYRYRLHTEVIKEARETAGLTVTDLAALADTNPYEIAQLEQDRYVPPVTIVRRITLALGIQAHDVIEWPRPPVFYEMPELSGVPEYEPPEYPA